MKKNRAKEETLLHSSEQLQQKSGSEKILVFLVLAIFILILNVISANRHYLQKNTPPDPATTAEKYVWLTGSPEFHDGLYVFTPEQLDGKFTGRGSFLTEATTLEPDAMIQAIRFDAGRPQPIRLPPAVANIFFQPIPINRADKDILTSLPGIGPVLAEKIVQQRNGRGPFRSKDELLHIPGIGPKKFAGIVDHITLD